MKSTLLLTIFVCTLLASANSFKINSHEQLPVSNQQQYAQLIKALLGSNSEDTSDQLKQFIKQNRLSLLNAAEEITILLTETHNSEESENQFKITKQFVDILGSDTQNINIQNLFGKSSSEISEIVAEKKGTNSKVHIIEGDKNELKAFESLLKVHKRRLLEGTSAEKSSSYITKFFFSLMFIIVSFSSLGAIAYMQNGKDTLLYAKFIADVGR